MLTVDWVAVCRCFKKHKKSKVAALHSWAVVYHSMESVHTLQKHLGSSKKSILTNLAATLDGIDFYKARLQEYLNDVSGAMQFSGSIEDIKAVVEKPLEVSREVAVSLQSALNKLSEMVGCVRPAITKHLEERLLRKTVDLSKQALQMQGLEPTIPAAIAELLNEAAIVFPMDENITECQTSLAELVQKTQKQMDGAKLKALCKRVLASCKFGGKKGVWSTLAGFTKLQPAATEHIDGSNEMKEVLQSTLDKVLEVFMDRFKEQAALTEVEESESMACITILASAMGEVAVGNPLLAEGLLNAYKASSVRKDVARELSEGAPLSSTVCDAEWFHNLESVVGALEAELKSLLDMHLGPAKVNVEEAITKQESDLAIALTWCEGTESMTFGEVSVHANSTLLKFETKVRDCAASLQEVPNTAHQSCRNAPSGNMFIKATFLTAKIVCLLHMSDVSTKLGTKQVVDLYKLIVDLAAQPCDADLVSRAQMLIKKVHAAKFIAEFFGTFKEDLGVMKTRSLAQKLVKDLRFLQGNMKNAEKAYLPAAMLGKLGQLISMSHQ
eukprot:6491931-Amphidinium_carterae.2